MGKQNSHPMKACCSYLDIKRGPSATAPMKKLPCFDKLDKVLSDKLTSLPNHLLSSSGLQNENLKNNEEEENLEMDLRVILLDFHHHPANTYVNPT